MQDEKRPEDVIRAFTREDYLDQNGEPYRYLLSFSEDYFQYEMLRTIMTERAKELKIGRFTAMLQGYVKSRADRTKQQIETGRIAYDDQKIELKTGMYHCDEMGVRVDAPYTGGEIVVCSHPIMPVKRLINIDTGEVKVEIAYKRGGVWRTAVFDKPTLSTARSITTLSSYGIDVTSESAKELVKYLAYIENENYDTIPEEKMISRLGWVDGEGFSPYIDSIVYDHGGKYVEEFKSIKAGGSFDEWLKLAKQVRAGSCIPTRIALAASFGSVLVKKLNALPFIVHLWGSVAGIGKSVAAILAASVWAYPEIGYYIKTSKGTDVGYEEMAFFVGNMPLILDELQLIQHKKNFDEMIYSLCEGVGKMRGSKTGGLRQMNRWCNSILTTGEQPIISANSKAGAVNRVMEVECTDKTFPDPRAAYQTLVHNYGHAGRIFVEKLMDEPDAIQCMKDAQQKFYDAMAGKATDKQVLTGSIILAADYMANLFLFDDDNCLTVDDILPYLVTKNQANINKSAYEWILQWADMNRSKFVPINGDTYAGEVWGRYATRNGNRPIDGDEPYMLYINANIFNQIMSDNGFNARAFLSWAAGEELIKRDGKNLCPKCHILPSDTRPRCVCLKIEYDNPESEPVEDDEIPF